MLCKSCHYPLKQLTEPRCPECGLAFDPNDSSTFDLPLPTTKRFLVSLLRIGGLTYFAMLAFTTYAFLAERAVQPPGVAPDLVVLISLAAVAALGYWAPVFVVVSLVYICVTWAIPYLIPRGLKKRRSKPP